MKPRLALFAPSATLATLFLLAGCGSEEDPAATASSGATTGGTGLLPGGAGGLGWGGVQSSAGVSGQGSGGANSGAVGGQGSGGASGAGSGGESSAAAGSGTAGSIPATFDTVKLVLGGGGGIMPCFAAPCHGVNGMAPPGRPLELPPNDDEKLYTNLTTYVSTACNDHKLVEPGEPAQSALVSILSGPCGRTPRMPYGCSAQAGDCIPDEYIAAVAQWIAEGAPR